MCAKYNFINMHIIHFPPYKKCLNLRHLIVHQHFSGDQSLKINDPFK